MKPEEQIEALTESNEVVDERKELRKWCFEKAMQHNAEVSHHAGNWHE